MGGSYMAQETSMGGSGANELFTWVNLTARRRYHRRHPTSHWENKKENGRNFYATYLRRKLKRNMPLLCRDPYLLTGHAPWPFLRFFPLFEPSPTDRMAVQRRSKPRSQPTAWAAFAVPMARQEYNARIHRSSWGIRGSYRDWVPDNAERLNDGLSLLEFLWMKKVKVNPTKALTSLLFVNQRFKKINREIFKWR